MASNEVDQNQLNIENFPPIVEIAEDNMSATVELPLLPAGVQQVKYAAGDIIKALNSAGVVYGIDQEEVLEMANNSVYGIPRKVAEGVEPTEGRPGEFTYHFETEINPEPKIREDGSVDYKDMKTVETVSAGDVIATYVPAVQGTNGRTVRGVELPAKLMRDQPPLPGRGFDRSADGTVYTANTTGKIEIINKRIVISPIYELKGAVGVETGNIDFAGDVIVHGTVSNGVTVSASGNITVDGVVENATLIAKKNIFLLSGVKGKGTCEIHANGDIKAQFIELASIECGGNIEADVFYDSQVSCNGSINLTGKKSSILGGSTSAVEGITVNSLGNEYGVITKVYAGATPQNTKEKANLEKEIADLDANLTKIKNGIARFEEIAEQTGINYREDPRRIQLLRVKIHDEAVLQESRMRLEEINDIISRGRRATIKANKIVYTGVEVEINGHRLRVRETQPDIEFVRTDEGIRMQHMKD